MTKEKMILIGITAVVTLVLANKLRSLPLVNKLPTA
jgi:Ni/Fe-hydrogenase subunit HybB-like protein